MNGPLTGLVSIGRVRLVGFPELVLFDRICWVGRLGWIFWVEFVGLGLLLGKVCWVGSTGLGLPGSRVMLWFSELCYISK